MGKRFLLNVITYPAKLNIMRHFSTFAMGFLFISLTLLEISCSSQLSKAQNYPQSPTLDPVQKEELLSTLFPSFPKINAGNIEQELQPYVLVKGKAHALPQFITFDNELHQQWRMNKLAFIPFWKVKSAPHVDILFMEGYGYAGPVWAYILFNETDQTIMDIRFFHKKETLSYGAEISKDWYQEQYAGAKLSLEGKLNLMDNPKREVYTFGGVKLDGASGSTVTNNGIKAMFNNMLVHYEPLILPTQNP